MHEPRPRLSEADLDEIEAEAETNAAETYRGPLLALVGEVRRLRGIVLEGSPASGRRDMKTMRTLEGRRP